MSKLSKYWLYYTLFNNDTFPEDSFLFSIYSAKTHTWMKLKYRMLYIILILFYEVLPIFRSTLVPSLRNMFYIFPQLWFTNTSIRHQIKQQVTPHSLGIQHIIPERLGCTFKNLLTPILPDLWYYKLLLHFFCHTFVY